MIISCPQCQARYQVAVGVVMRRPKLKCAQCGHRWVPAEEIDEDEAVAAVQEEVREARMPPPPPPAPEPEPEPQADPGPPPPERVPVLKWLVAIVFGVALTIANVGLWIGRVDPEQLPGVADVLDTLSPGARPGAGLEVAMAGQVTRLPGGGAILEITGTLTNRTKQPLAVPPLEASVLIAGRPVRHWRIPAPASSVGAGKALAFASSITDVPQGPVTVQVRFVR